MPEATITVAGITPPERGKQQGKITDTEGNKWNAWGDKLHNYQMGMTYKIVYEENEFNNHKFNLIKTAQKTSAAPPLTRGTSPASAPTFTPPLPSPKDEMIFVCGALNNAMGNPNVNPLNLTPTEIANFVMTLRQVWRGTLGRQEQPKTEQAPKREDMDDEIPF